MVWGGLKHVTLVIGVVSNIIISTKKKNAQCALPFIWGKNKDCSPGDSTSHSSERWLQRGGGGKVRI